MPDKKNFVPLVSAGIRMAEFTERVLIKAKKGTILEENYGRTEGSIGESVAAGAIFTIPAFYIVYLHKQQQDVEVQNFFICGITSLILISGGILEIMFFAFLRKLMADELEPLFPESLAASGIPKSGSLQGIDRQIKVSY